MTSAFQTDAAGAWIQKDPDAVVDYHVAWADWLAGDTIASVVWTVPAGLTKGTEAVNSGPLTLDGVSQPANTVATVWLSGGTAGTEYPIGCRITTAGGRTDERSFRVAVSDR